MIIGLAGKTQSGKSTIAKFLLEHPNHVFYQVSFTEPVQEYLPFLLNIPHEVFHHQQFKNKEIEGIGKTPRQLMDSLIENWGYKVNPLLWEVIAQQKILEIQQHSPQAGIIVPDIRNNTQAYLIRNQGGIIWHIERPAHPYPSTGGISEYPITILNDEKVIFNDGTLEKLQNTINALLTHITAKKGSENENFKTSATK